MDIRKLKVVIKNQAKQEEPMAPVRAYVSSYRLKTFHVELVKDPAVKPLGESTRSSYDIEPMVRAIYRKLDADKEHFTLLACNNKNRVVGYKIVSTGSLTATMVHPREVWRSALHLCAAAVIFVHNHPSGDPAPSFEDKDLTKRLKEVGEIIGIRVLDHIVLGDGIFYSFSDRGQL